MQGEVDPLVAGKSIVLRATQKAPSMKNSGEGFPAVGKGGGSWPCNLNLRCRFKMNLRCRFKNELGWGEVCSVAPHFWIAMLKLNPHSPAVDVGHYVGSSGSGKLEMNGVLSWNRTLFLIFTPHYPKLPPVLPAPPRISSEQKVKEDEVYRENGQSCPSLRRIWLQRAGLLRPVPPIVRLPGELPCTHCGGGPGRP